jgi:hypothetical protein
MKCVAKHWTGAAWVYLTPRRSTGRMYEDRSSWGSFDDAKIFNTRAAATNSARQNLGHDGFEVVPVTIVEGTWT